MSEDAAVGVDVEAGLPPGAAQSGVAQPRQADRPLALAVQPVEHRVAAGKRKHRWLGESKRSDYEVSRGNAPNQSSSSEHRFTA